MLEKARDRLPDWLMFVTDVNVAGLLSFALAAGGMIVVSILTGPRAGAAQRPPAEAPQ